MTNATALELLDQGKETAKNTLTKLKSINVSSRAPQNLALGGLAVGGVVIAGGIVSAAITGVVAVAAAGTFAVAGWYGFHKIKVNAPVFRKNMQLQAMQSLEEGVKEMKIFHLQQAVLEKTAEATNILEGVTNLKALQMSLTDQLRNFEEGGEGYAHVEREISRITEIHDKVKKVHQITLASNQEFSKKVVEARHLNKVSELISSVTDNLKGLSGATLDDFLNTDAFDAINEDYNKGIAQIESYLTAAGV